MADAPSLVMAVSGALVMGYAVAALFFARFWRRTRVALFAWFAVAFALLAAQRVMLVVAAPAAGDMPWSYVVRLLAFVLILAGIVTQNRAPRRG
jgi:hypothetical protein